MDRSRRGGTKLARPSSESNVPAASRLTVRARKNRKKPGSLWSRMPRPRVMVDACGRAVRRAVPALAATAAISAIGTGVWLGYRFVTTSERFAITSIEVHGASHLTQDEIKAALPVHVGDNVFATNLGTVANALRDRPWIAAAEAHRVLPHTLVVEVKEHVAAAVVELGDLYLVDAQGRPFKRADVAAGEGAGLPIITGIDRVTYSVDPEGTAALVTGALDALTTWRAAGERPAIGELHLDSHHGLTLHTYERATAIELGPIGPELATRMQTFDAAWAELTDAERATARAIHLDARTDHVTVAFAKD